ncbi:MAG: monovalent cation/H+ antiporter subunit D family protein [Candidatus Thiodiazotropha lotti]|uniref:Monovalent cation/H+ antiporter subunit D family protein n=1 Tax=Candidatus Thiodiazotropha lotti TaxID=2792787 RepID=A0A9E4K860_9GAMM|nr:monovalent cation/H+ antiporter subunit D family protein [Candidatus Thiodiazotropha lotti]MCG7930568.1 monovalent cation/H+ antiporter subunit D family protein [Candidatus Thiodiazotropha lotti]MCG7940154.1 monovalent cation/H+ antiporter subunit D family protein [Candidatus Thiodiazotropha lotti]MCW4204628.1 monovalent cation/H+ antiporter subunit D family protein [Candidatus Thiodiazotropha lotti]MCW4220412.1 monovalent cation/H+ antiporter subunit D family protein [Candidatus Thiodiazotr
MGNHISLLLVIVPLIAAPLVAVLPRGRLPWAASFFVSVVCAVFAGIQLWSVLQGGVISYELGGWAPPWGIEYRIDAVNAFVALIVAVIAALTLPYALHSVEREIPEEKIPTFYSALLLCLTGLLGITQTGDIFNVFVFLEISSLSSYALISLGKSRQAFTSSYQYLIMGTIGATFYLIGVGLLYSQTGTLNMQDMANILPSVLHLNTVETGFTFIMVGIALKLALFPLHLWLPNAYTYAPSVVTVFLAATATKVAVYVMLRILFTVFPQTFTIATPADELFIVAGMAGVIIASVYAIYQKNIKRLLAYSSVAQIGYMVLGIGFATATGLMATLIHLFNHALMKGALFMAIGAIIYRIDSCRLDQIHGLGRAMPWTFGAIVLGGLSLIGVPGTAGFISKWYLVTAALEQSAWLPVAVILIGSLLAVVYMGKLIEALYFKPVTDNGKVVTEAPLMLLMPTWCLVLANIYFGLDTDLTVGVAEQAAAILGGMKP